MKRLVLRLVVILFSIEAIGCDSGGGTSGSPAPAVETPAPGAGTPAKGAGKVAKSPPPLSNPNGPKHDH
jgi:hypothetical protein